MIAVAHLDRLAYGKVVPAFSEAMFMRAHGAPIVDVQSL